MKSFNSYINNWTYKYFYNKGKTQSEKIIGIFMIYFTWFYTD